jgi:hypothetical protein
LPRPIGEPQMAELVEDHEIGADELGGEATRPARSRLGLELVGGNARWGRGVALSGGVAA